MAIYHEGETSAQIRVDEHSTSFKGTSRSSGSPWLPAIIAAVTALVFVVERWATWAKHDIANFILVGRHFAVPSQLPHGIPVQPAYGYDGQFFYRLALNPVNWNPTAYGIRVDHTYRFMRIGYPVATWLLTAGQHSLVPEGLVAVNILAVGALGYVGGMLARQGNRNAVWGLLIPAYFGLVTSVSRDTAEPLSAVCLLAGLLAQRARRPLLAGLLLAYGALTRETVMVAVAAIALVRVMSLTRYRRKPGREDLSWLIPGAAFTAWQAVLFAVTGSVALATDSGRNTGLPFAAPLHALAVNIRHLNTAKFDQYDLWLLEVGALALCSVTAIALLRASRAPAWEKLALPLYIVEICLVNQNTWNSLDADLRSFIEVYLIAMIIILSAPPGNLGARFGWALPGIGVWMVLAIGGVMQRRLTISFRALKPLYPNSQRFLADGPMSLAVPQLLPPCAHHSARLERSRGSHGNGQVLHCDSALQRRRVRARTSEPTGRGYGEAGRADGGYHGR